MKRCFITYLVLLLIVPIALSAQDNRFSFRKKEKKLYAISDAIGCMSQANVDYVLKHNPEIDKSKVEICPNSIEFEDKTVTVEEKISLREKYGIPLDKKVFVYGGNLGKPQGIPFLMDCLKAEKENTNAYFLIVGDGTEFNKLKTFMQSFFIFASHPFLLINQLKINIRSGTNKKVY